MEQCHKAILLVVPLELGNTACPSSTKGCSKDVCSLEVGAKGSL